MIADGGSIFAHSENKNMIAERRINFCSFRTAAHRNVKVTFVDKQDTDAHNTHVHTTNNRKKIRAEYKKLARR